MKPFKGMLPGEAEAKLNAIARLLLDRAPTPAEKDHYLPKLEKGIYPPVDVLSFLARSPEFSAKIWNVAVDAATESCIKLLSLDLSYDEIQSFKAMYRGQFSPYAENVMLGRIICSLVCSHQYLSKYGDDEIPSGPTIPDGGRKTRKQRRVNR